MWSMTLAVTLLALTFTHGAPSGDEIVNLPGLPERAPPFQQYSGYLRASSTRRYHYWLVESQRSPKTDPLVLWLNGGPGCSSMEGLLTENGPFRVSKGGKALYYNEYSWNKVANVLYLESPAGVGFSVAEDGNYTTNDDQVAEDNHNAILEFLHKFPEYQDRPFYVSGESYAGIYIPTLLVRIVSDPRINIKGALIGNGYMNPNMLDDTKYPFWYYHGLISTSMWNELVSECCDGNDCQFVPFRSKDCQMAVARVTIAAMSEAINPYNIYGSCDQATLQATKTPRTRRLLAMFFRQMTSSFDEPTVKREVHRLSEQLETSPPCTDSTDLELYLNQPDVTSALHVDAHLPRWTLCSSVIAEGTPPYTYSRIYEDMTPQFKAILGSGKCRMLIFNGDFDTVCNFFGDERFVDGLNLTEKFSRQPWYYTSAEDGTEQIGGFQHQFEGLTFLTVKGAGHMVPTDQPVPSYEMFTRFLEDAYI